MNNVKKVKIKLINFFLKIPKEANERKGAMKETWVMAYTLPLLLLQNLHIRMVSRGKLLYYLFDSIFIKVFLCDWNIDAGIFHQSYFLSIFSVGLTLYPWVIETHTWWPQWWPRWRGRWWASAASSATSPPAWSPPAPALSLWSTAKLKIWKVKKNVLP